MSKISLAPDASGTGIFTIASPNSNTNRTLTLPDDTGTIVTNSGNQAGSFTTLNTSGAVVFNDAGADVDFRVEGDTDANLLFVDASADSVGIGTNTPSTYGKFVAYSSGGYAAVTTDGHLDLVQLLDVATAGGRLIGSSNQGILGGIGIEQTTTGAKGGFIAFRTCASGTNTQTERMRIDSSGNVGMGTSSLTSITGSISTLSLGGTNAGVSGGIAYQVNGTPKAYDYVESDVRKIQTVSGVPIAFIPAGSEAARIDSSGRLLVGTTAVGAITSGLIEVKFDGSLINGIFYNDTRTGAGNDNAAIFVRGSTTVGVLRTTTTDLSLVNLSDQRVKTNIQNSNSAIDLVDSVQVRQFDWTIDDSHEDFGFVAQELNEVFPQAVSVGKTEEEMWGVNLSKLVPVLTKAIQELKAELDTVKAELATLKG